VVLGLAGLDQEPAPVGDERGELMEGLHRVLRRAEVRTSEQLVEIRHAHSADRSPRVCRGDRTDEHDRRVRLALGDVAARDPDHRRTEPGLLDLAGDAFVAPTTFAQPSPTRFACLRHRPEIHRNGPPAVDAPQPERAALPAGEDEHIPARVDRRPHDVEEA
jgi:hypothetical protein